MEKTNITVESVLRLLEPMFWRIPTADDLRRMTYFTIFNYANIIAGFIFIIVAILQVRSGVVSLYLFGLSVSYLSLGPSVSVQGLLFGISALLNNIISNGSYFFLTNSP